MIDQSNTIKYKFELLRFQFVDKKLLTTEQKRIIELSSLKCEQMSINDIVASKDSTDILYFDDIPYFTETPYPGIIENKYTKELFITQDALSKKRVKLLSVKTLEVIKKTMAISYIKGYFYEIENEDSRKCLKEIMEYMDRNKKLNIEKLKEHMKGYTSCDFIGKLIPKPEDPEFNMAVLLLHNVNNIKFYRML